MLTAQAALASDEQKLVRVRAFSYLVSKLTKKATMVVIGNNTYHWRSCAVGFTTALFKGEVYTVWGSNAKPGYACMFDAALAFLTSAAAMAYFPLWSPEVRLYIDSRSLSFTHYLSQVGS